MKSSQDSDLGHVVLLVAALFAVIFMVVALIGCSEPQGEEWQVNKIKPVIEYYGTEDCAACKKQFPHLRRIAAKHTDLFSIRERAPTADVKTVPLYVIRVGGVEKMRTYNLVDALIWVRDYYVSPAP